MSHYPQVSPVASPLPAPQDGPHARPGVYRRKLHTLMYCYANHALLVTVLYCKSHYLQVSPAASLLFMPGWAPRRPRSVLEEAIAQKTAKSAPPVLTKEEVGLSNRHVQNKSLNPKH